MKRYKEAFFHRSKAAGKSRRQFIFNKVQFSDQNTP